jgi:hypothetical protein
MSKTYQLKQQYGPKHVLHPFIFECSLCKTWIRCTSCMLYAHNYCDDCIQGVMDLPQQETNEQEKMIKNDRL